MFKINNNIKNTDVNKIKVNINVDNVNNVNIINNIVLKTPIKNYSWDDLKVLSSI
jgi:hypothetical protein